MSILVTGGRGKTSSRLSTLLNNAAIPFVVASRSPKSSSQYKEIKFDWSDQSQWDSIFKTTTPPIKAVYLCPPSGMDPTIIQPFVSFARLHGVTRFVFLSTSAIEAGGPLYGQVHQYLIDSGVDYAVLRPSWFMQNFSEEQHLPTIKSEGKVYSATQDGKIPFVSAEDIAAVAFHCLTDERSHNTDHIIVGPEVLSYDAVAEIISNVTGRRVTHARLTGPELAEHYTSMGFPQQVGEMLAGMDINIAQGSEDRINDEVEKVTGHAPTSFKDFAENNRQVWL